MLTPGEFHQLLRQAQGGDKDAMDRLLAAMRPQMEELARGYADPARAAESTQDVVQEAWLRAWQRLEQFKGAASSGENQAMFRAWVAQLVRRVGLNTQRSWKTQRRRPREGHIIPLQSPINAGDPSPSAEASLGEEARLVRAALAKITDPTDVTILRLRFFEGVSLREISRRLNLSYDKVRERFEAGMRVLEEELGGLDESL
jgi:RNA polymerase sigma factor (sigma-70 family)